MTTIFSHAKVMDGWELFRKLSAILVAESAEGLLLGFPASNIQQKHLALRSALTRVLDTIRTICTSSVEPLGHRRAHDLSGCRAVSTFQLLRNWGTASDLVILWRKGNNSEVRTTYGYQTASARARRQPQTVLEPHWEVPTQRQAA